MDSQSSSLRLLAKAKSALSQGVDVVKEYYQRTNQFTEEDFKRIEDAFKAEDGNEDATHDFVNEDDWLEVDEQELASIPEDKMYDVHQRLGTTKGDIPEATNFQLHLRTAQSILQEGPSALLNLSPVRSVYEMDARDWRKLGLEAFRRSRPLVESGFEGVKSIIWPDANVQPKAELPFSNTGARTCPTLDSDGMEVSMFVEHGRFQNEDAVKIDRDGFVDVPLISSQMYGSQEMIRGQQFDHSPLQGGEITHLSLTQQSPYASDRRKFVTTTKSSQPPSKRSQRLATTSAGQDGCGTPPPDATKQSRVRRSFRTSPLQHNSETNVRNASKSLQSSSDFRRNFRRHSAPTTDQESSAAMSVMIVPVPVVRNVETNGRRSLLHRHCASEPPRQTHPYTTDEEQRANDGADFNSTYEEDVH